VNNNGSCVVQVRNSSNGYGVVPKVFHWATVVLVMIGWSLGQLGDDLPHPMHAAGLVVHISIGVTILMLLVARLAWRIFDPPPPPEKTAFGAGGELGSKFIHGVLYALLLAIPSMGVVVQFARGHALPIFSVVDIASPWARDREFARAMLSIHELLANSLMLVAVLHGGAALTHHFVLRDRTLRRMLPGAA
jgi:cytochrome b561